MSGIVGILHLDGAPVQLDLLQGLTDFLRFRGPDKRQVWTEACVGFGHAYLHTNAESKHEQQPLRLSDGTCLVADARVDARPDLLARLRSGGLEVPGVATDAELILRAYQLWDEDCVQHLLGDFVFAIWDQPRRRLFCARDQMGVKPFFYAQLGSRVVFSNTLDCIRKHPSVSDRLNDLAIADFLLFDISQDPSATSFADIRQLPPAHILECQQGRLKTRRYWELSVTTPIHHRAAGECVEQFRHLLDTAVADRLRAASAGVLMSGGLDSPTVAASARRVLSGSGEAASLCAYTEVFDRLIPHRERHYARLVAESLGIPIEFHLSDDSRLFSRALQPQYRRPEPAHSAWPDTTTEQLRELASSSRIALTGFGADPALACRLTSHFRLLWKNRQWGRAFANALGYLTAQGRFSRLYLRTRWRLLFAPDRENPQYPPWLNEDLEKRLDLRDRWHALTQPEALPPAVRPEAHALITAPFWTGVFYENDAGVTRIPVEVRHPFFDLRLMNFLLALPALPWCSDKELLRQAAHGVLPDAIRLRRKSPLPADPLVALLQQSESSWVDRFEPVPELDPYVVRERIPNVFQGKDPLGAWMNLRPLSLNLWLRSTYPQASRG